MKFPDWVLKKGIRVSIPLHTISEIGGSKIMGLFSFNKIKGNIAKRIVDYVKGAPKVMETLLNFAWGFAQDKIVGFLKDPKQIKTALAFLIDNLNNLIDTPEERESMTEGAVKFLHFIPAEDVRKVFSYLENANDYLQKLESNLRGIEYIDATKLEDNS